MWEGIDRIWQKDKNDVCIQWQNSNIKLRPFVTNCLKEPKWHQSSSRRTTKLKPLSRIVMVGF